MTRRSFVAAVTLLLSLAATPGSPAASSAAGVRRPSLPGVLSPSERLQRLSGMEMTREKGLLSPAWRKVSRLLREEIALSTPGAFPGAFTLPPFITSRPDGSIKASFRFSRLGAADREALRLAGVELTYEDASGLVAEGWILPGRVLSVAALDFVSGIRPAFRPMTSTGSVESEGDGILRADLARTHFGITGAGVTVGVLSDSVDGIASSKSTLDLPSSVQVLQAGQGEGEGTAMLEIVHDLAPGAGLAFYGPSTSGDMITGVGRLAGAGARVIVDDLTFFDQPCFEEGPIALAVDALASQGVIYATSSGNFAQSSGADRGHYEGAFDGGGPIGGPTHNVHLFAPSDALQQITVLPGAAGVIFLQWADKFGAASDDYDVYVVDGQGTVVAQSDNPQNGNDDPMETVFLDNRGSASPATVFVVVDLFNGAPRPFKMFYSGITNIEHGSAVSSLAGHANASGAITVGTINADDPGNDDIAPYSSQGPANIFFPAPELRDKPDVTGIDGVSVTGAAGFPSPFFGTSAAAPHVAAVAALMVSKKPALDLTLLKAAMQASAVDLGAAGFDTVFGAGLVDADAALAAIDGGAPPLLDTLAVDLDGDNLDVELTGSDADADVEEVDLVLRDSVGAPIAFPGRFLAPVSGMMSITIGGPIGGMSGVPAATQAQLRFIDARGNASNGLTADFSAAAPGGPSVTIAKFSKKKRTLTIKGTGFGGTLAIEVNGTQVATPLRLNRKGIVLKTKGTKTILGLVPGPNRIRVLSNGLHSNIFLLKI